MTVAMPAVQRPSALICGGGPTSFATALSLARRGWAVKIVETRPSPDFFEPDKAFCYLIDGRGQTFLEKEGLGLGRLADIGVCSSNMEITRLFPDKPRETKSVNFTADDDGRKPGYWVPRHAFIRYLAEECEARYPELISVLYSNRVVDIVRKQDSDCYEVLTVQEGEEGGGRQSRHTCNLLVGADGMNSLVRQCLQKFEKEDGGDPARFEVVRIKTGSTGLKYKVLPFPSNFFLDEEKDGGIGERERAKGNQTYVAIGIPLPHSKRIIRLGFLPSKDESAPRPANIVTFPNHKIWSLKTGEEVRSFLARSFPQLPILDLVSPQVADDFAKNKGGEFPAPQHAAHLCRREKGGQYGCVLLGDAAHAFPPDLGQGVNSALEDVVVFSQALEKISSPPSKSSTLGDALEKYEKDRMPDVKALIRLVKIGYPWQYRQSKVRDVLWTANFVFRMTLVKIFPRGFFYPQVMRMIGDHNLSYSEIVKRADRTTRRIFLAAAAFLVVISKMAFR